MSGGRIFDIITANPPYIASAEIAELMADVRDFEPRMALDGGVDGLDFIRRIVIDAPRFLVSDGSIAIEVGAGEAPAVKALFEEHGYRNVRVDRDYGKIERVVSALRPPP